ncbi:MAG: N-acetylmuramoyl-L-alanine amidase [Bacteroidota bacterium]
MQNTFRRITLLIISFSLFINISHAQDSDNFTIIVDAGHGGHDSGTIGNNKYKRYEKDVALSVALKFGKLVEKNMKDVNVVYTRTTDVFIKLKDRPTVANKKDADLFVSIHCNGNKNTDASGSETYVLGMHKNKANFEVAKKENSVIFLENDYSMSYQGFDPNSVESIIALTLDQERYLEKSLILASLVQKNFKTSTPLKNRGVKQAGFWVLAQTYMPSILTELGFLSNDKDAKLLMSESGQNKIANSLFQAFKEYKSYWDDQTIAGNDLSFETTMIEEGDSPIKYAVQFMISKNKLSENSSYFKGLDNVSYYKEGAYYKYVYYKSSDYLEVISRQKVVKEKGFNGAFIVAFKEDKRISLDEALKEEAKTIKGE